MSYGQPQFRPGPPLHPQQRPPGGGGNAVVKTCLIVFAIVSGLGLIVIVACGLAGFFFVREGQKLADEAQQEMEQQMRKAEQQRGGALPSAVPVNPPENIDQALKYCDRDEARYLAAGAEYLARQPRTPGRQVAVQKALLAALNSSSRDAQKAALTGLANWGDENAAAAVAAGLRPRDQLNRQRLDLLGNWKSKVGLEQIVKLLESPQDSAFAVAALKSIGPDAAPALAPYLTKSGSAKEQAEMLLASWNVDRSAALIQSHLRTLRNGNVFERRDAAAALAAMPVNEASQPAVLEAVRASHQANPRESGPTLTVLKAWGDASSLDILHDIIRKGGREEAEAIRIAADIQDPSSLPVISSRLTEFGAPANAIEEGLIAFGEPAVDAVLKYVNSPDRHARERARRVIDQLDPKTAQVLDQIISDLKGDDERAKLAANWLQGREVDETRQNEVAEALAGAIQKFNVFDKRAAAKVFADWATPDQLETLLTLLEERDENVWLPAFQASLRMDQPEAIKLATAQLLSERWKREKARDEMYKAGPAVEPLAILMLAHNDEEVLIEMVGLLATVGGEDALQALDRFEDVASKARRGDLARAARTAKSNIRKRLRKTETDGATDGDG